MNKKITLVDYGIGNVFSVRRAFEIVGANVVLSNQPKDIVKADRVVLPGVGAFADCMSALRKQGLIEPLLQFAETNRPLLGICVGMQMLATWSEEFGHHDGFDLIPGGVVSIPDCAVDLQPMKAPFVGWATITNCSNKGTDGHARTMLDSHNEEDAVYLVHSFHLRPSNPDHLLATYESGGHQITAAVQKDNLIGVQFHPERSGPAGLKILNQFIQMG